MQEHIDDSRTDRSSPYVTESPPVALRSAVLLRTPPDAQPPTCSRSVIDRLGFVGSLRAPEYAEVHEALADIKARLHIMQPISTSPENVNVWREVDRVYFPEQVDPGASPCVDLRTRWEKYQQIRYLPIVYSGVVKVPMLAPYSASLMEVQGRVWRWSN